ncbi:MAG: SURF1 family protein [Phenylobacterium sp.]
MTDAWEPRLEPKAGRPAAAPRRGVPVGMTIAVAIAFAILVGLGVWQLQRLKWKEGVLAHVAHLERAKAQALDYVLDEAARGRDVEFTRVAVVCPGLASAPYLEVYDLRDGQAGVRLVSACRIDNSNYNSILVDRGFVPDSSPARPQVDAKDTTPIEVEGVLRKPERGNFATPKNRPGHWFLHEVPGMAKALGAAAPAPVFLFAESRTNPGIGALTPAALPPEIPNNHFQYALTWFGLAGALAGVYGAALVKRLKG